MYSRTRIESKSYGNLADNVKRAPMITVVDDDESVRKALNRLIKTAGYDATTYESAEAFLATNAGRISDCLILDVHLPGKSGLELQAELVESGTNCPIVFITAFDDEQTRSRAMAIGAVDFLCKPLDTERLLEVIRIALQKR